MLFINDDLSIPDWCIQITAIRAQGAGGQHVNKTSTGIHLRLFIPSTPLPEYVKYKLRNLRDHHITQDGWIIIKAQNHRSQEQNKKDALDRLKDLILKALQRRKYRRPTRPTRGSVERRITAKKNRGETKQGRKSINDDDE